MRCVGLYLFVLLLLCSPLLANGQPSYLKDLEERRALRKEAFEIGVSTTHNAAYPELVYTKDVTQKEFEHYSEDPDYVQPTINLTPLGESLLGIRE